MSANLDQPAKVQMNSVIIDGVDVLGMFVSIEIFENIFIGGVTGSLVIMDNDGVSFIEKQELEFTEDISFEFVNAAGVQLKFEGQMNGLRGEQTSQQIKMYTIDFTSKQVRKNEMVFINRAFVKESPEAIVQEMVEEKLGGTYIVGSKGAQGEPMTWVAGNRKPIDIIRYVLNHGVAIDGQPTYSKNDDGTGTSTGSSGFLCWETLDGYRFCSMKNLFEEGNFAPTHTEYANRLANTPISGQQKMKTIMSYDFPQLGDAFQKIRSGSVKNRLVSFDLDTGVLNNLMFEAQTGDVTEKLRGIVEQPTRTLVKMFTNEKFRNSCEIEAADVGDQSRKYLSQTISRQNNFSDTHGRITLAAQYNVRAGDMIDIQIYKIQYGGTSREPQTKHSGKYLISQVGHHFFRDGHSYTKLALIRDNKRQNQKEAS